MTSVKHTCFDLTVSVLCCSSCGMPLQVSLALVHVMYLTIVSVAVSCNMMRACAACGVLGYSRSTGRVRRYALHVKKWHANVHCSHGGHSWRPRQAAADTDTRGIHTAHKQIHSDLAGTFSDADAPNAWCTGGAIHSAAWVYLLWCGSNADL